MSESNEVAKQNRKLITVALFILLMLSTACNKDVPSPLPDNPEPETQQTYVSPFKKVSKTSGYFYLTRNPIEEYYRESADDNGHRDVKISITGLKDKVIEKKINDQLNDQHEKVKDAEQPPYRGIIRVITEDHKLTEKYVSTNLLFNSDNIISAVSQGYQTFSESQTNTITVEYVETLNLDLNTGEKILLKDLFVDNTDYLARLNELVVQHISREFLSDESNNDYPNLALSSPFKGLKENQKFAIFDDQIILYMDYQTPEFDTQFLALQISIPLRKLSSILAVKERFGGGDLYTRKGTDTHILIPSEFKYIKGETEQLTEGRKTITKRSDIPYDLPKDLVEKFIDFTVFDSENIDKYDDPDIQMNIWQNSSVMFVGKYLAFDKLISVQGGGFNMFSNEFLILDENEEEVTLKSLFIDSFDFESRLKRVFKEAADQSQYTLSDDELDRLFADQHFKLYPTGIQLVTEPVAFSDTELYPINYSVEFSQIGYENLTVFD